MQLGKHEAANAHTQRQGPPWGESRSWCGECMHLRHFSRKSLGDARVFRSNGADRSLLQRHQIGEEIFALLITEAIDQALGHQRLPQELRGRDVFAFDPFIT